MLTHGVGLGKLSANSLKTFEELFSRANHNGPRLLSSLISPAEFPIQTVADNSLFNDLHRPCAAAASTMQRRGNKFGLSAICVFIASLFGLTTDRRRINGFFLLEIPMFKRLFILGSFAMLPVAAMGNCSSSGSNMSSGSGTSADRAGMLTLSVPTGQGAPLSITVAGTPNAQQSVQAPYALTGASATDAPHQYRQIVAGEGGMVQVQTD